MPSTVLWVGFQLLPGLVDRVEQKDIDQLHARSQKGPNQNAQNPARNKVHGQQDPGQTKRHTVQCQLVSHVSTPVHNVANHVKIRAHVFEGRRAGKIDEERKAHKT